ncbi:MAG: GAF and ANTAR domain-containing protein [Nitriliruptor sp.]
MSADEQVLTSHEGYLAAIHSLSGLLIHESSLETTLDQLLHVARRAAPGADALTVTVLDDAGGYTSAATTDDAARSVDELEYLIEQGPCIEALHTGEEQLVRDTRRDDRWPRFNTAAADAGFSTVAGLPLSAPNGTVLGALNVFARASDGLADSDLATLREVAAPAGAVLANARALRRTAAVSDELSATLEEQALWHRAIGIILGRHGGDQRSAVATLHRTADAEQLPPAVVAEQLARGAPVTLRHD